METKQETIATIASTSDDRTVDNTMCNQYRALSEYETTAMLFIKNMGMDFHQLLNNLGDSRELSLAKTKVEEAVMWAVKHITA